MYRFILVLLMSAALGACAAQTTQTTLPAVTASLEATASSALPSRPYQPASDRQALVHLPSAAGPITDVRNNRFANGIHQTIGLGRSVLGLKPNAIDLRLRAATDVATIETIAMVQPTEAMIRDELASQFPNMEMRIVEQPRRNAAGVYGLAVGRWENGARCVYAWQWIDNPQKTQTLSIYDAATIRVRLCGNGVTLDHLAGLIDDLQFSQAPIDSKPRAAVAKIETVKPRRHHAAHTAPQMDPRTTNVSRHRGWDAAALRQPPIIPTSEHFADTSVSTLDPGLPAAAFRGPATTIKTANR